MLSLKFNLKNSYLVFCAIILSACGGGSDEYGQSIPKLSKSPIELKSGILLGLERWSQNGNGASGPIDGVECLKNEDYHIHAHLSIFVDGVRQAIPKNIGLNGCALELHTHDESGIIHVETNILKKFTLGNFFSVWSEPLSQNNIAGISGIPIKVYVVDGDSVNEVKNDYRDIELKAHQSINIFIGSVPAEIQSYSWPTDL